MSLEVTWNSPERPPLKPQGSGSSFISWAEGWCCPPMESKHKTTSEASACQALSTEICYPCGRCTTSCILNILTCVVWSSLEEWFPHLVFSHRLGPDRPHSWCHRCSCRGRTECCGSGRLTDGWTSAPPLRTCHQTAALLSTTALSEKHNKHKCNGCRTKVTLYAFSKSTNTQHYLVWFCSGSLTVVLEPVQLLQHGPGRRPVFVRQVEEVRQQLQVI